MEDVSRPLCIFERAKMNMPIHRARNVCSVMYAPMYVCLCVRARLCEWMYAMFAEWKRAKLILICLWISGVYVREMKPDRLFSSLMLLFFFFYYISSWCCVMFVFLLWFYIFYYWYQLVGNKYAESEKERANEEKERNQVCARKWDGTLKSGGRFENEMWKWFS